MANIILGRKLPSHYDCSTDTYK